MQGIRRGERLLIAVETGRNKGRNKGNKGREGISREGISREGRESRRRRKGIRQEEERNKAGNEGRE